MSKIKTYIALFETDPQVKSLGVVLPLLPGPLWVAIKNFEKVKCSLLPFQSAYFLQVFVHGPFDIFKYL